MLRGRTQLGGKPLRTMGETYWFEVPEPIEGKLRRREWL